MQPMLHRIRPVAIVAVAALALAGCTSHSSPPTSTPTTSAAPAGGSGALGSASPAAPVASASPVRPPGSTPAGYPADPGRYTQAAVAAWQDRDTVRLNQLIAAGNQIFNNLAKGNYDHHFQLYQCDGAAGSSICAFYNNVGDVLQLRVGNTLLGQPHALLDGKIDPITFPADPKAYGQLALDAWRDRNTNRLALLTTAAAKAHFDAVPASHRGDSWTFDHGEGAAGSSYLSWRNPAEDTITFRFLNAGVAPSAGPQHRIVDVLFEVHH